MCTVCVYAYLSVFVLFCLPLLSRSLARIEGQKSVLESMEVISITNQLVQCTCARARACVCGWVGGCVCGWVWVWVWGCESGGVVWCGGGGVGGG